MLGKSPVTAMN